MHFKNIVTIFLREACCMVSLLTELKNDAFVPFFDAKSFKNGG